MLTLAEMYRRGTLVSSMYQKMYFSNVNQHTEEFKELVKVIQKDVMSLSKATPSEDTAYKIVSLLNEQDCILSLHFYVWEAHYEKSEIVGLKEQIDRLLISDFRKEKLYKILGKSIPLIQDKRKQEYVKKLIELENIDKNKTERENNLIQKIKKLERVYSDDIHNFRSKRGFVVLNKKSNDDWVDKKSLSVFNENSEILGQDGPTLLVDYLEFNGNMLRLKESLDREFYYTKANQTDEIDKIWNKSLKAKSQLAKMNGFNNYLDMITHGNILGNSNDVKHYLESNLKKYESSYLSIIKEITKKSSENGLSQANVWDINYYLNLLYPDTLKASDSFKLEDAFNVLKEFLAKEMNIKISYKKLAKEGLNFWFTLKDNQTGLRENVLLSNLSDSNISVRHSEVFVKGKISNYSFVNLQLENHGFLSIYDIGVLFHEFGHIIQNFLSLNKKENLTKEKWETIEVPSIFLEKFIMNYKYLKDIPYYKDKNKPPKKLSKYYFDKIMVSENILRKDFECYTRTMKSLIMVEAYSRSGDVLREQDTAAFIREELKFKKIPYLWSDDADNFSSNMFSDYGALSYIYLLGEDINQKIIEKINSKVIIDNNVLNVNYLFRNIFTNNDGISSIDKIKRIFKE